MQNLISIDKYQVSTFHSKVSFVVCLYGRSFVKRFALCYRTVSALSILSCPVCLCVCHIGVWLVDGSRWNSAWS